MSAVRCGKLALAMLGAFLVLAVCPAAFASTGGASTGAVVGATPRAASHSARISGDRVTWTSTFAGNDGPLPSESNLVRVDLDHPVPGELDVARSPGVAVVTNAAREIVACIIDAARVPDWRGDIHVTVVQDLARDGRDVILQPPLVAGRAIQRIDVRGDGDETFEPSALSGLVHEVGSWSASDIPEGSRRETDALLAVHGEGALYVEASPDLARGLRGRALTAAERARPGIVMAVVVFVLLVALMAAAYSWLSRAARVERAEAYLREEYER